MRVAFGFHHHTRHPRSRWLFTSLGARVTTIQTESVAEETIKKSRFVATCLRADTYAEVVQFVKKASDPKARHNCWGWVGSQSQRSSDDGEPTGSAGRPILNAIEGEGISYCVVLVTRYKAKDAPMLGAGGLLRAYGSAARLVLRAASRIDVIPSVVMQIRYPLASQGAIQTLFAKYGGRRAGTGALVRRDESYEVGETGETVVSARASIEADFSAAFSYEAGEISHGLAEITWEEATP